MLLQQECNKDNQFKSNVYIMPKKKIIVIHVLNYIMYDNEHV